MSINWDAVRKRSAIYFTELKNSYGRSNREMSRAAGLAHDEYRRFATGERLPTFRTLYLMEKNLRMFSSKEYFGDIVDRWEE